MDITGLSNNLIGQIVAFASLALAFVLVGIIFKRSVPLLVTILLFFGVIVYSIKDEGQWIVDTVGWAIDLMTR